MNNSSQAALTTDFWERLRIILKEVDGNRGKILPSQILFLEEVASDFAEHSQICSILPSRQDVEKKLVFMKTLPDANFNNWYHLEYESWAAKSPHLNLICQAITEELKKLANTPDEFGTVYSFAKNRKHGVVDKETMQWALEWLAAYRPQVDFRKWYEGGSYSGDPLIVAWSIIQQAKLTEDPEKLANLYLDAEYQKAGLKEERSRWSEWPLPVPPWITLEDAQTVVVNSLKNSSVSNFGSWMRAVYARRSFPNALFPIVLERMEQFAKSGEDWHWYYCTVAHQSDNPEHPAIKELRKNRALDKLIKIGSLANWLDIYIHNLGSPAEKERAIYEIKKRVDSQKAVEMIISRLCPSMSDNWVLQHDVQYRLLPWALNELKSQLANI